MKLILHPPRANGRRTYGVQFTVNGTPVTSPTPVTTGDIVGWEYLGGNISQGPDGGAAWSALKKLGMDTAGKSGSFTIPPTP